MATKSQQERVNKWVIKWKDKLLLGNWGVTINYVEKDAENERSDRESTLTAADIIVDSRYNEARIRIYPTFFTRPIGYQQSTIVHELLHIITDPTRTALDRASTKKVITEKLRDDILEGLTEHYTKIVFKAYVRRQDNYHI